jgi:iron(III) transport system permease protein
VAYATEAVQREGVGTRRRQLTQQQVVLPIVVVITMLLVVGPLLILVKSSLTPGTALPFDSWALTLANYGAAFGAADTYRLALNTLWYASGSVLEGLVLAGLAAWLTERSDLPGRRAIRILMFVSMALPPLVLSFGWILLLNPGNGALNVWLKNLFGFAESPFDIYTMWMMIFITGLALVPTMYVMLSGLFRNMDPLLESAGTAAGGSRLAILRHITLPVLSPGIISVFIYLFMIMVQAFDTPLAIGLTAGVPVLSTRIYLLSTPEQAAPKYGLGAAFGVTLLLLALVLIWAYFRATRQGEKYRVVTGKGFRPKRIELGTWKLPAVGFVGIYFVLMLLPVLILLWTSFLPFYRVPSPEAARAMTFNNYFSIAEQSLVRRAIGNTVLLVFSSATLTMLLSCLISWYSVRSKVRGAKLLETLAFTPLAVPQIVMAIALLLLYIRTPLYGSIWLIVLGHVTVYLAFGTRTMNAALLQVHQELENAATASGASWGTTLRYVLGPLLWPHILNGWLWVVAHSMRDLTIPLMLMTTGNVVISSALWLLWGFPNIPGAAALAMLMILGLMLLVVPIQVHAAQQSEGGR